ncbi:MAG: hypothetical protein FWF52_05420 [Candidatus Azobacteroides sp.]|nr:hypothetical protein [Candidatus Azobacteroides sp.]
MKQKVLIALLICASCVRLSAFAQQSDESKREGFEKMKAERKEFVSKAMNLTDDEKNAFWPLCDELQMKKFELNKPLREEIRKIMKAKADNQTVSEADYKRVIEMSVQVKLKEAQLDQEYIEKFLKVIPAEKVFLYQGAEQQFGKNMMRGFDGRNPNKQRNPDRRNPDNVPDSKPTT